MKKLLYLSSLILFVFSLIAFGVDQQSTQKRKGPIRSVPTKPASRAAGRKTTQRIEPIKRSQVALPDDNVLRIIRGSNTVSPAPKPFQIAACTLPDGNIFLGWEAFAQMAGQSHLGRAAWGGKYNPKNLTRFGGEMMYSHARDSYFLSYNRAIAFANGNVLVAYNDQQSYSVAKGTLVVLSSSLRIKTGPVHFCQTKVRDIAMASLPGNMAILIAYCDEKATTGRGKFLIVDYTGKILVQPKAFTYKHDLSMFSAGTTSNGLIMIAFNGHEKNGPLTGSSNIIIDAYGNTIRPLRSFWNHRTIEDLQICPLSNATVLGAGNHNGKASCFVVDNQTNKMVHSFKPFHNGAVSNIQLTRLDNDRVFISFSPSEQPKAMCAIVDATGAVVKDPIVVPIFPEFQIQSSLRTIAQTRLNDNSVLVFVHGFERVDSDKMISAWYVMR